MVFYYDKKGTINYYDFVLLLYYIGILNRANLLNNGEDKRKKGQPFGCLF